MLIVSQLISVSFLYQVKDKGTDTVMVTLIVHHMLS